MTDDPTNQGLRRFVEAFRQALIASRRKHFELGRFLSKIRTDRLYREWPRADGEGRGYSTWRAFCAVETSYSDRTCDTHILNYERLVALGLNEDGPTFARCMRIGWSKLSKLLRVASTETALLDYLSMAEENTDTQLTALIAERIRGDHAEAEEQRREEAEESGDDYEEQTLGDPNRPLSPTNPVGYVPFQLRFADQGSLDTFSNAVEIIRDRFAPDLGHGKCVEMMALHYLSTHARDEEGGVVLDVETYITMFEEATGVALQVVPQRSKPKPSSTAARKRSRARARAASTD
jgi:hypothetical protein